MQKAERISQQQTGHSVLFLKRNWCYKKQASLLISAYLFCSDLGDPNYIGSEILAKTQQTQRKLVHFVN